MSSTATRKARSSRWVFIGILLAVSVFILLGVHRVPPEHRGVQFHRFGGGTNPDKTLEEGSHWLSPWDRVFFYPITASDILADTRTSGPDETPIKISYLIRFELEPTLLPQLHKSVGPDYVDDLIRPTVESALATVAKSNELDAEAAAMPIDDWSRLAAMQISPRLEEAGIHLIYFRIQSIATPKR